MVRWRCRSGGPGKGSATVGSLGVEGYRLKSAAEPLLELVPISSAQGQPRAVLQEHDVFAVERRLQFSYSLDVHDVAAMDPEEGFGIELRFNDNAARGS